MRQFVLKPVMQVATESTVLVDSGRVMTEQASSALSLGFMFRRYAIAFRNLVSPCFIRIESSPMYWWEDGVTRVISFAVAVKMKPRHVVISTEF
jgi:hypothetical protein